MGLVHGHAGELVLRVGDHGGVGAVGEGLEDLDPVGDGVGVVDDDLLCPVAQVGKLLQHLLGGLEIQGRLEGRVVKAQLVKQDLAVDGVLGLQKMHVPRGHGHLAQLIAQGEDPAVDVVEALRVLHLALPQEEGVVAVGLDLQVVVIGSDLQELLLRLPGQNRPIQLPRLAGRAQNEAAPKDGEHAPGDLGLAGPQMIQVGKADELIEVLHARLILGQDDDMVGLLLLLLQVPIPLGGGVRHHGQALHPHLLQLLHHLEQEHGAGVGVVVRPVVAAHVDGKMFAEGVQLVVGHVVMEDIAGEHEGVRIGQVEADAELLPVEGDKARVELGVVGHQAGAAAEFPKTLEGLPAGRGAGKHILRDAGELGDLLGDDHPVVDEGVEPLGDLAVHQADGADLDDVALLGLQARGLDVEGHELPLHGHVHRVGQQIALHPVEGLDAGGLGGLGGLGEGLHVAVVRDGQGLVAPAGGGLEGLGQVREPVHGGHAGVQMELRPLALGRVLAQYSVGKVAVVDIEIQLRVVFAAPAGAPKDEVLPLLLGGLDPEQKPLGFPLLKEGGLAVDGIGEVRHVHLDPPAALAVLLPVAPALPQGGGHQAALDGKEPVPLRQIVDGGPLAPGDPAAQQDAVFRQVRLDDVGLLLHGHRRRGGHGGGRGRGPGRGGRFRRLFRRFRGPDGVGKGEAVAIQQGPHGRLKGAKLLLGQGGAEGAGNLHRAGAPKEVHVLDGDLLFRDACLLVRRSQGLLHVYLTYVRCVRAYDALALRLLLVQHLVGFRHQAV